MRRESAVRIHFRAWDFQNFLPTLGWEKEAHVSGDFFCLSIIFAEPEIGARVTAVERRNRKSSVSLVEPLENPGVLKLLSERAEQSRALRGLFCDLT